MGIRNRFIYFAGRAAAGVCAALGIWWSCAMTSFADEAIKSVTIAVTSSVEMGGSGSVHQVSCGVLRVYQRKDILEGGGNPAYIH